ncbi:MAG: hypothetical protein AAF654_05450 [Myxococcota bacterium]
MAAATVLASSPNPRTVEGRLEIALENYRSWAGGLGLIHNNFGTDWATELQHAEERVVSAFRELLAEKPAERKAAEAALEAEGLSVPAK